MLTALCIALVALQSAPTLGVERYEVDPRASTVGFDGTSTLHDFTGKTHAITGDLRVDRTDPARLSGGTVWIEAGTLDTDNRARDREMRDLLDVKAHPRIVFCLDSVQGKLVDGKGELTAVGRFTIKGVEKPRVVRFHVDPVPPDTRAQEPDLRVQGELRFAMTEHGIERPGILFAKVADEVRVWLDLRLHPVLDAGVDALVRAVQVEESFVPDGPGAEPRKSAGTELAWRTDTDVLWERRLAPVWILQDAQGLTAIDPRTGRTRPPDELAREAMERLSKPAAAGTTWSATTDAPGGRRTLRLTFADEVPARLPAWALEPTTWSDAASTGAPH